MGKYEYDLETTADRKLIKIEQDKDLSDRNREIILNYLNDAIIGKTIRKGQKKEVSPARTLQTASWLIRMAKEWFKKDLDKVTNKDMEKFILDLNKGKIKHTRHKDKKKRDYSEATKSNIKKFMRKFYKYILGENKYYPDMVEWIDTSTRQTLIEAIPGLDISVLKIIELIPDLKRKALLYTAFDSGFRRTEILTTRMKDLQKSKNGSFIISCHKSKTFPRAVEVPLATKLIDRWLEIHPDKDNPNSNLFQTSTAMFYKTMKLYSKKALGKPYTPHQLRHTSATFYSTRLNRSAFCKRFGWSYSSKIPDMYIDFAKTQQSDVTSIIESEKIGEVRKENQDLKIRLANIEEKYETLIEILHTNKQLREALLQAKI